MKIFYICEGEIVSDVKENYPSIEALRAFLLVAETKTVKEAAGKLGLTPSAVSQSLFRLEKDLGTELFQRDVRPLRLNASGRALVPEARAIVAAARALKHRMTADPSTLTLRIGLGETVSATVAPWMLAALWSCVGRLETVSGFTQPLVTALREDKVDVVVTPEGLLNEDRWARERLYEEDFLLVTGRDAPFPETAEALRKLARTRPVVDYGEGSSDEIAMDRVLRSMNAEPLRRVAVSSSHALVGLIAETGGWSVLPVTNLWCGRTFLEGIRFGPLPEGRRLLRTMWATGDALCASDAVRLTGEAAREAFAKRFLPELERTSKELVRYVRVG